MTLSSKSVRLTSSRRCSTYRFKRKTKFFLQNSGIKFHSRPPSPPYGRHHCHCNHLDRRSLQHPCHAEDRQRTGAVSDRVGIVRLRRVYCMAGILRICSVILKKETPRRAAPAERRRGGGRINHHCRRDRRCCGMAPGRYRLWGKRQRQRQRRPKRG